MRRLCDNIRYVINICDDTVYICHLMCDWSLGARKIIHSICSLKMVVTHTKTPLSFCVDECRGSITKRHVRLTAVCMYMLRLYMYNIRYKNIAGKLHFRVELWSVPQWAVILLCDFVFRLIILFFFFFIRLLPLWRVQFSRFSLYIYTHVLNIYSVGATVVWPLLFFSTCSLCLVLRACLDGALD
jgi:hypothetical protein